MAAPASVRQTVHSPECVSVVVADAEPLFRRGAVEALADAPEFTVVGEVGDGPAVMDALRRERPRLALVDLQLPRFDIVEAITEIERDGLGTAVVLVARNGSADAIFDALGAGVAGCVTRDADADELRNMLGVVAGGGSAVPASLHSPLVEAIRVRHQRDHGTLTEREREVLGLAAHGCSGPEIGRRLFVSETTVKTHLHRAYRKLGVRDRASAVFEGYRRGLID